MPGIKDQKRLEEMRKRLYARNAEEVHMVRHDLSPETKARAERTWREEASPADQVTNTHQRRMDVRATMPRARSSSNSDESLPHTFAERDEQQRQANEQPRRRYRARLVVLGGLALFVGIAFSAYYLFFGLNEISSRNIEITVSAPSSIGAGETVPIDVSIRNDNPVPIVSGTLIVEYPSGTRDAEEPGRQLRTDRISVERIAVGETATIPVRAVIFGEEGEEKAVQSRLTYRVEGTNSILERRLEPIMFRITSAPIVMRVDTTERVSAGHEVVINIDVNSNAPSDIANILVTANYPNVFDFVESSPAPIFNNNTWRIDQLAAGGTEQITIRGVFTGQQSDQFVIDFNAGLPQEENALALGSVFSTFRSEFFIERPFIEIDLAINNQRSRPVILEDDRQTNVQIRIENTLDSPVYDMRGVARLSGNALNPNRVQVTSGFYDSFDNTVRFNSNTNRDLERVEAGGRRSFSFNLSPDQIATGQVEIEFDVFARRVSDTSAQEELFGSQIATVQYSSPIVVTPELRHQAEPFGDSGPVPPVAEVPTTYTIYLTAQAGNNDIVEGQVVTTLPTYIEWLDRYNGPGTVSYNPVNQQLTWAVGSLSAQERALLEMQIRFRPSRSQIGNVVTILNRPDFRATDRFTGTVVRAQGDNLTSEFSRELGFGLGSGRVRASISEPAIIEDDDQELAEDDES